MGQSRKETLDLMLVMHHQLITVFTARPSSEAREEATRRGCSSLGSAAQEGEASVQPPDAETDQAGSREAE